MVTVLLPGSHGNIFSIPYATYAISIDAGALLLGARDPLVNCDSEIPEINAAIQIGGARALWDRSSHASLPFMSQVLQDIAHGTGIRSNQGMMSTVYVKHPCVSVVFFVFFASSLLASLLAPLLVSLVLLKNRLPFCFTYM